MCILLHHRVCREREREREPPEDHMLLFSTQQDRLKQTETVKVGQSARCVCVYPSFFTTLQTSTSSFVYIHSRFCAQLRVQCAMDCH